MRRIWLVLALAPVVFGDTVVLKSGLKLYGKVKKTDGKIAITINGKTQTIKRTEPRFLFPYSTPHPIDFDVVFNGATPECFPYTEHVFTLYRFRHSDGHTSAHYLGHEPLPVWALPHPGAYYERRRP